MNISTLFQPVAGLFHELSTSIATFYTLVITSLISFLINWSCKKAQTIPLSLYKTSFQRYSLYIVNTDWLCLETHTVPAGRHCHKSSPSFLSLYLSGLSRTLPGVRCCMQIFWWATDCFGIFLLASDLPWTCRPVHDGAGSLLTSAFFLCFPVPLP